MINYDLKVQLNQSFFEHAMRNEMPGDIVDTVLSCLLAATDCDEEDRLTILRLLAVEAKKSGLIDDLQELAKMVS